MQIEIWNPDGSAIDSTITGVEMRRPMRPNDQVGLLLRGNKTLQCADDVQIGAYLRERRKR